MLLDVDIPPCFDNPFDVRLSEVMSLLKGFSVVGLALGRFFQERTKLCFSSAPLALTQMLALMWGPNGYGIQRATLHLGLHT